MEEARAASRGRGRLEEPTLRQLPMVPRARPHRAELDTQAHLTIAYGDNVHTCAAAVNAENLRRIDPHRRRIAFAWGLSEEARAILSYGWEVREVPEPSGGTPARKAVVLDARVRAGNRALLSRAIYWDTDHFPLRSGARNIEQLWAGHPDASMVASPEPGSRGCFSGGLLVYRPSVERRSEYERLIGLGRAEVPHKCAHQMPDHDDQRYINEAFRSTVLAELDANRTSFQPLLFETWAVRAPGSFLGRSRPLGPRLDCQRTPKQLEALADSYHFYGRTPPWGGNCAECVLRGLPCNLELARRAGKILQRPACAYFAAQSLWYAAFAQLPARLRSLCFDRIRDTSSIETSARAKLGKRGIGTGAFAGCNLTDAARASDSDALDWATPRAGTAQGGWNKRVAVGSLG